jgi:hypothetical protein
LKTETDIRRNGQKCLFSVTDFAVAKLKWHGKTGMAS